MREAIINIKTEKAIKQSAQKIANRLGLSLSAVLNAYLRQFVRSKEVHFRLGHTMSEELEKLLGRTEFDIQRNKNISKEFSSKGELERHFASL